MQHDYRKPFDMWLLKDHIVMAFTDPMDCFNDNLQEEPENNYQYFTDSFTGMGIHTYYLFDTKEEFIQKWSELQNKPNGMWYWVLDNATLICSGAMDPDDILIFNDYWNTNFAYQSNTNNDDNKSSDIWDFVQQNIQKHPKANRTVLTFIGQFLYHKEDTSDMLKRIFIEGYCYYFGIMLQHAFPGGKLLWAAPNDHIVYQYQGQYYDISGIYEDTAFSFIPIERMGDCLLDFKHIPNQEYNATDQELAKIQCDWHEEQQKQKGNSHE